LTFKEVEKLILKDRLVLL